VERSTHLLYLDESGTHGGSPCLIVAGLAIHERDAWFLQRRLQDVLSRLLPAGHDPSDYELHASEIKSPSAQHRPAGAWSGIPIDTRLKVLAATYRCIRDFRPVDARFPAALFGAVVEGHDREARAYEEVLHKFDEMLNRRTRELGERQTGFVIHDKGATERDVQKAAHTWRHISGRMGLLTHLADVPVFADSKASRLIQAADFVAWALWRYYGLTASDVTMIEPLWSKFDAADGVMHGLIHVSPRFRSGCVCPPCASRHKALGGTEPGSAGHAP